MREYRYGGVDRLKERMQRSGASKVTATTYNPGSPNQQYRFDVARWIRSATKHVADAFMTILDARNSSLQACSSRADVKTAATYINMPSLRVLHLLACMHQTQQRKRLVQERVDAIENDRELFCFIKTQLNSTRNSLWTILNMRTVTGIHFTKVCLS